MDLQKMMEDAIGVAEQAIDHGEVPIGAVLYDADGQRIAHGWNQRRSTGDTTRHAEMVAFQSAAKPDRPIPKNLFLVSTLEPCVMCWGACLELEVATLIYGLEAPTNGGSTRVKDPQRQRKVIGHVMRDRCRQVFVDWMDTHADHPGAGFVRDLLKHT